MNPCRSALRKIPLWTQEDPILDVAVLEENAAPTRIAVLEPEKVSIYRLQGGKWQQEQSLGIVHARPWPRDLRGRLMPARDHLLDVYLPGVICRDAGNAADVELPRERRSVAAGSAALSGGTFFGAFRARACRHGASTVVSADGSVLCSDAQLLHRALTPGVGKFTTVPKFYSAALLPRDKYTLWLFAATDGQVHMVDGVSDQRPDSDGAAICEREDSVRRGMAGAGDEFWRGERRFGAGV